MLGVCQRVAAIPMKRAAPAETRFLERDEIEATAPPPAPRGPPRPAGPSPAAVPLQHRGAGARGRRPARRAPRPRRAPARAPPRQGRQVADLPALAPDRATARELLDSADPPPTPQTPVFSRTRAGRSPAPASTRSCAATPPASTTRAPIAGSARTRSATLRRAPARGRRRGQRHPRLARPRRPHHDQPLRRDQHQDQNGGAARTRAASYSVGPRTTPIWRSDETLLNWLDLALTVMCPI